MADERTPATPVEGALPAMEAAPEAKVVAETKEATSKEAPKEKESY